MEGTWNSHGVGDSMWKVLIWEARERQIEDYGNLGKERVWTVDIVLKICLPPAATHFLPCGDSVSMHFIRFSVHIPIARISLKKHRLVFIMETDFVHCAVRIKFLYAIWNNFSKTSLWEIFYSVCHPEVFNTYINIQWCISQTQQNFIMFIIVLGWHVSIPIESSSGPSKNTDPYLAMGDLWWTNWQWERFFLPVFRLVETLRYKPQVPWVRFPMAPLT